MSHARGALVASYVLNVHRYLQIGRALPLKKRIGNMSGYGKKHTGYNIACLKHKNIGVPHFVA